MVADCRQSQANGAPHRKEEESNCQSFSKAAYEEKKIEQSFRVHKEVIVFFLNTKRVNRILCSTEGLKRRRQECVVTLVLETRAAVSMDSR